MEGLRAIIRRHVALAGELASWVDAAPDFERLAPVPFGLVCFRYRPPGVAEEELDRLNERLLTAVNATGRVFMTHTRLGGRYTIRLVIGQRATERRHVEEAWGLIREAACVTLNEVKGGHAEHGPASSALSPRARARMGAAGADTGPCGTTRTRRSPPALPERPRGRPRPRPPVPDR